MASDDNLRHRRTTRRDRPSPLRARVSAPRRRSRRTDRVDEPSSSKEEASPCRAEAGPSVVHRPEGTRVVSDLRHVREENGVPGRGRAQAHQDRRLPLLIGRRRDFGAQALTLQFSRLSRGESREAVRASLSRLREEDRASPSILAFPRPGPSTRSYGVSEGLAMILPFGTRRVDAEGWERRNSTGEPSILGRSPSWTTARRTGSW